MHESARTKEDEPRARHARFAVGKEGLVLLETPEANGHLGHDTRDDGAETLVEADWRLATDDVRAGSKEAAGLFTVRASLAGELHAHLDGVERWLLAEHAWCTYGGR